MGVSSVSNPAGIQLAAVICIPPPRYTLKLSGSPPVGKMQRGEEAFAILFISLCSVSHDMSLCERTE